MQARLGEALLLRPVVAALMAVAPRRRSSAGAARRVLIRTESAELATTDTTVELITHCSEYTPASENSIELLNLVRSYRAEYQLFAGFENNMVHSEPIGRMSHGFCRYSNKSTET